MATARTRVEATLEHWLPGAEVRPKRLHRAMRYASLDGGKRIRPVLVYAAGLATGGALEQLDGPACAVELIHAYSLVHDDLPAMDDDELRRGKPTCHRAFSEDTALLAGDALQSLAFQILAEDPMLAVTPVTRLEMVAMLARASGSLGMAGGQALDLEAVGLPLGLAELEEMHRRKTGALIRASVGLGVLAAGCADALTRERLDRYATAVGLAFQIQDDILDVAGDTATLGKTQGADIARNKPTYPALLGLEGARRKCRDLQAEAGAALAPLGKAAEPLRALAQFVIDRAH
jgi:geranylgeranyl pyrophosphate synthase